jgi:hypothetical protein
MLLVCVATFCCVLETFRRVELRVLLTVRVIAFLGTIDVVV